MAIDAAERKGHVDVLQVVLPRTPHDECPGRFAPQSRHLDTPAPSDVVRRQAALGLGERRGWPLERHLPAEVPRARSEIHDVIRRQDRLLVVLDDEDGVTQISKVVEGADQPLVVARMKPDARLIEHVEHPGQLAAELTRQADPLRFAAGEGRSRAVEAQVLEPDVEQELEPAVDFAKRPLRDLTVALP